MFSKLQKNLRAAVSAAAVAVLCATAMPAANASVVYDNLGSSQDGSDPIFGFGPLANSFTTGSNINGYVLNSFKALLKSGSASIVGDIEVTLHSNSGNAPGAELVSLGTLSSADVDTGAFGVYGFSPLASFVLAANTTYWLEIAAETANAIEWAWSNDLLGTGVAGQFNYSAALGTNANSAFGPYQMAVDVSQIPEPASLALLSLALGLMVATSRRRHNG
jgi:hypothetical protein